MLIDWRNLFINYEKRGSKKMEVVYNVKYRFKNRATSNKSKGF